MSPLDHKLARDLWRMKGQAVAIGAVIAVGVMMLVMMTGLVASLEETRRAYYERYRLADVFAPVARAPMRLLRPLAQIPGVAAVEGRVTGGALVNITGRDLPVQAQALSLPDLHEPRLNDIYLTAGRKIAPGRTDEVLLLESFAKAHGLKPGDSLRATMNGAQRSFAIVGLAQSPEFLYITAPGEIVPDDARFGVIWMSQSGLAASFDMEGAFNEAILSLTREANEAQVIAAVDRILNPYGGRGAYPLADQFSNRFVSEEIGGLRATSKAVPPIFLGVAAFLLYIVISRMVQAEREEIGLMKAFGYTSAEVGAHYFKLVLVIAVGGAVAGSLMGIASGRALIQVYTIYYKFPFLLFQLDPASFLTGFVVSVVSASAGGLFVLRRVFALTPSEAMRAPSPPDYSRSGRIGLGLVRMLDQPSRMVLRRLTREPLRMAGAVIGIAAGMGLSVGMLTIYVGFDRAIELTFGAVDRSDMSVAFTLPASDTAIHDLQHLPGVLNVEPMRIVPVVLRHGLRTHRGAINGLIERPSLNRALDKDAAPIALREDGLILASSLAQKLDVAPGDTITVEVREGRRPVLELPVAGVADTLLGAPAFMEIGALNRALREEGRVSGAFLQIDEAQAGALYPELRNMPLVAGVSLKSEAEQSLRTMMDTGAGAMRYVMGALAFIITFGIIHNSARIAFAERARDLGSLRVIGFTRAETAFVLLGELGAVTLLAIPLGSLMGYGLSFAIAAGFSTELYQIPVIASPRTYGFAAIFVLGAACVSGWLVKRDLDQIDLVETLKTRE